jgi:hypothetical protein
MILFTSTIVNITETNITDMLGWTTSIIDDLKGIWLLILGILLGVSVLIIVIRALRGSND